MAQHEIVDMTLSEFAGNMHFKREGLPEYGLKKIVSHVAQVVLARARNIDPNDLKVTSEEADDYHKKLIDVCVKSGKAVTIVQIDRNHKKVQ
jgi:hypothetical protein